MAITKVKLYEGSNTDALVSGRLFMGVQPVAGAAIITTATTGGHPSIWNPAGSGVNLALISLELAQIDGTNAPTTFGWYKTSNAGSAFATGAPVATWTNVAPLPCLVGGTSIAKAFWAPTTNTFTSAPAYHCSIGLNLYTVALATAAPGVIFRFAYNGELGVAPGTVLSLCSTSATTTSKFAVKLVWEEIPV